MTVSPLLHRPALKLALLLCLGILLARYIQLPTFISLIATAVFLVCGILFSRKRVSSVFLSLCVVLLGASLHLYQKEDFDAKKLVPVSDEETVVLTGTLVEPPVVRPNRIQFVLDVASLSRSGVPQYLERRIVVHGRPTVFAGVLDSLTVGREMTAQGNLEVYPQQRNPGEFDYGRYLELNSIHGIVMVRDTEHIYLSNSSSFWSPSYIPQRMRANLVQYINSLHHERIAGFLNGILLADRSNIPEDVRQSFVDTGTVHVLAVSGLHVGVIALIFYGVFGLFRLPRTAIVYCTIIGLLCYMLLVGAPPSVVRATVMAVAILLGLIIERRIDIYQSLSIAALVLLLWDSNNLFHVGFQLSFAAVLSIVYFYPIFSGYLRRSSSRLLQLQPVTWIAQLCAVSLAAQVGTLPFTAYYFDVISVISLLANLIVVPVVGFNVTLGFATLVFAPISTWLAENYAALNEFLATGLLVIVDYAAKVPYASFSTAGLEATFPFYYYLGLIGITHVRNAKVVKACSIFGLVLVNITVYSSLVHAEEAKLRVTFLDVWQGDAIFIESPSGKKILLDAGGRSDTFDSGERTITPFLRYHGIRELDAIIMSHPHSDHIGGVSSLFDNFEVKRLAEPTVAGESATYEGIYRKAKEQSIPSVKYDVGDMIEIDETMRMYVLHPYFEQDSTESLNNASLVIKLVYGSYALLFVGDAERAVEGKLVRRYGTFLKSNLFKIGHHGSNTSSTPDFITAVQPTTGVISVGRNNAFGHPAKEVLGLLRSRGVEIHRTDKEGAIIFESDGETFQFVDWRN